jgi:hypothetical protein
MIENLIYPINDTFFWKNKIIQNNVSAYATTEKPPSKLPIQPIKRAYVKKSITHSFDFIPFPPGGTGVSGFSGAVKADDGRIIFVPHHSLVVGIFDPATDTYTAGPAHGREIGGNQMDLGAFCGGVKADDGRIIFSPMCSTRVGIFDPETNLYTDGPAHGQGFSYTNQMPSAFNGAVKAEDGRIIFPPFNSRVVGIFDPASDTYINGPTHRIGAAGRFFSGGVKADNGNIIFVPMYSSIGLNYINPIGIFIPEENRYVNGPSLSQIGEPGNDFFRAFSGGAKADDGRIIFAPFGVNQANLNAPSTRIGIYDPDANVYIHGPAHGFILQQNRRGVFDGAVKADDGRIILVPRNNSVVGIFDPKTDTYKNGPTVWGGNNIGGDGFSGGAKVDDGRIIFAPFNANGIGIYSMEIN